MSSPEAPAAGRVAPVLLFGLIALRIAVSPSIYPWTGAAWNAAALLFLLLTLDRPRMGGRDSRPAWTLIAGVILYFLPAVISSLLWTVNGRGLFPVSNAGGLAWTLTGLGGLLLFAGALRRARLK